MHWKEISKCVSEDLYNDFVREQRISCPCDFDELRHQLVTLYDKTRASLNQFERHKYEYRLDSQFGIKFYMLMKDKYQLGTRQAGSTGFWRFLSLKVIPDIVADRCGLDHPDKFWRKSRRIWLYVIWWFIHLSWQGNEEKTSEVIENLSTDFELQLVDRAGDYGYRLELCRTLMQKISILGWKKQEQFRKLMVLSTAWLQTIEPALYENAERGFVDSLVSHIQAKTIKE